MRILDGLTPKFFEMLDRPYFVRRIVFLWMVGLFTYATWWFFNFASTSTRPGAEIAMIIAAINTPLSFLLGVVMSLWKESMQSTATPPPG